MCFELEIKCRFLSRSNGWADVSLSIFTVVPNSDERITSARLSLLGATITTDVFCLSLLWLLL
jgi:hypothetical protein